MNITLNRNLKTSFKVCLESLLKNRIKIEKKDTKMEYISGSTKGTLLSWGEDVEVRLSKINDDKTSIKISSVAKAQLISWGKNNDNIDDIYKSIKMISKKY